MEHVKTIYSVRVFSGIETDCVYLPIKGYLWSSNQQISTLPYHSNVLHAVDKVELTDNDF